MNRIVAVAASLITVAASLSANAEQPAPYDYTTKFYPHPAMLFLHAEAPRERSEHPAVIVARRAQQTATSEDVTAAASKFYLHPAMLYLAATAPAEAPVRPAMTTMLAAGCTALDARC